MNKKPAELWQFLKDKACLIFISMINGLFYGSVAWLNRNPRSYRTSFKC